MQSLDSSYFPLPKGHSCHRLQTGLLGALDPVLRAAEQIRPGQYI